MERYCTCAPLCAVWLFLLVMLNPGKFALFSFACGLAFAAAMGCPLRLQHGSRRPSGRPARRSRRRLRCSHPAAG
eukprot:5441897-Prymnesium_polylepis.1